MNQYCVVLFDEIDKAHPDVTKLLLQILENGEISDSTGKKISLKHAIIILTTTVGAQEMSRANFGFGNKAIAPEQANKEVKEELKKHFSPEIINRLDEICVFQPLKSPDLAQIARLEIEELNERLVSHGTRLLADNDILNKLAERGNPKDGARVLRRALRAEVEKLLAEIILENKVKKNYQLILDSERLALK